MPSTEQIDALLHEAHTWIGTKYHPHACIKGAGVDCAQLLIGVAVGAGLVDPIVLRNDYSTVVPEGSEYVDTILKYCDEIPESDVRPGDIALYKTSHGWMHSAIVVDWPTVIIHAIEKRGVVRGHGKDEYCSGKPRRFFRLKENK
jgi:hypothetical protein